MLRKEITNGWTCMAMLDHPIVTNVQYSLMNVVFAYSWIVLAISHLVAIVEPVLYGRTRC